jgi:o-succinylbenzoate synthase
LPIEKVLLRPYALPLKQPWRAARATLAERRGVLIGVLAGDLAGWGDCAPLPSSGEDGHARAFAALERAARALRDVPVESALARLAGIDSPEARWAVETALLDLSSRRRGLPLRRAFNEKATDRLAVNAAVGPLDARCADRVAAALAEGFEFIKIKVGVDPPDEEQRRLRALACGLETRVRFRLDANRAWTWDQARFFLDGVADLPIDGVEEPLAAPTLADLRRLQDRFAFAIAVDESLFELGAENLFASRATRRLVLKPARVGGFAATLRLAESAALAGMEVVVTSVVDSAIGVAAAAQLAAALGGTQAHGLATSAWLARDVATPLGVSEGALVLPDGTGLGMAPDGEFAQLDAVGLAVGEVGQGVHAN